MTSPLQSRIATLAAADAQRRTAARDANRAMSPEFADFVDQVKKIFGSGVRVRYLRLPDGTERGRRGDPGVVPVVTPKSATKRNGR